MKASYFFVANVLQYLNLYLKEIVNCNKNFISKFTILGNETCPTGSSQIGTECYIPYHTPLSWNRAEMFCSEKLYGNLAKVDENVKDHLSFSNLGMFVSKIVILASFLKF